MSLLTSFTDYKFLMLFFRQKDSSWIKHEKNEVPPSPPTDVPKAEKPKPQNPKR